jgi:hypothetical protein
MVGISGRDSSWAHLAALSAMGLVRALTGTALANTLGPIGTQALTTGLASGTMTMLMVGDFWQGAFTGAISGGLSAWLSSIIPVASYKGKTGNMILNGIRNAFINAFSSFVSTGEYSFQASDALDLCGAKDAISEALSKALSPPALRCRSKVKAKSSKECLKNKRKYMKMRENSLTMFFIL